MLSSLHLTNRALLSPLWEGIGHRAGSQGLSEHWGVMVSLGLLLDSWLPRHHVRFSFSSVGLENSFYFFIFKLPLTTLTTHRDSSITTMATGGTCSLLDLPPCLLTLPLHQTTNFITTHDHGGNSLEETKA